MDFTSETFRVVSLAAPLDSRPTVTEPAGSEVVVAASLSAPQAARVPARVVAATAVRPRRENCVGMAVLRRWMRVRRNRAGRRGRERDRDGRGRGGRGRDRDGRGR